MLKLALRGVKFGAERVVGQSEIVGNGPIESNPWASSGNGGPGKG
jgi:hypothetical protein